jgi:hypothetical protein
LSADPLTDVAGPPRFAPIWRADLCVGGVAEVVSPIDPGAIVGGGGAGYGRSLEGLGGKLDDGEEGPGPPGTG